MTRQGLVQLLTVSFSLLGQRRLMQCLCAEDCLTVRVRYTASVMRDLQPAQNELVGPFLQPVQVKAVANPVWQSWHCPPPVCILHCLQLDVCRACCGAARSCFPSSCQKFCMSTLVTVMAISAAKLVPRQCVSRFDDAYAERPWRNRCHSSPPGIQSV